MAQHSSPVSVTAQAPLVGATALWRFAGQLMVTVIAKGSFSVAAGELVPAPAEPIRPGDETVPQRPSCDVTMAGFAYPPHEGATQSVARLTISAADGAALDKALVDKIAFVRGDRAASGDLKPFARVSLGYEQAYGGIGFADNPLGTGYGPNARAPALVDPRRPDHVAAFAPLPASFPARKRLLGAAKDRLAGRIAEIPDGFDWSYFHAAPADQRISGLRGGERLVALGVMAGGAPFECRIPIARVNAKIAGGGASLPGLVPLIIDSLHIEPERGACQLVWRGSFPVAGEGLLAGLKCAVSIEAEGDALRWAARADPGAPEWIEAEPDDGDRDDGDRYDGDRYDGDRYDGDGAATVALDSVDLGEGTVAMSPDEHILARAPSAPFRLATGHRERAPDSAIPGAPWSRDAAPDSKAPDSNFASTVCIGQTAADEERMAAEQQRARAEAEGEAAQRARAQAEEERRREAEQFQAEQEAARAAAERREAEHERERKVQAKRLHEGLYRGFKK